MTTYIAFLRGMNLGKRNIKMDELRAIFSGLKFANVRTYIASGNVIFDAKETDEAKLTAKIEKELKEKLGYQVFVILRTRAELEAVLKNNPFRDAAGAMGTYISFFAEAPPKAAAKEIEKNSSDTEIFKFKERELYMLFYVGFSDSLFFKKNNYEKLLGIKATNRNINTPVKILAMLEKDKN
jgi:uncharacterized protein (DUF1697 family)